VQQRLPCIGVPLRKEHPELALDLQAVFNTCYDNGGYADCLNYSQPSPVALSAEESACIKELVKGTQPSDENTEQ
jgi:hypothetical protein